MNIYPIEEENLGGYKSRFICEKNRCKGCKKDDADYKKQCLFELLSKESVLEIRHAIERKLEKYFSKHKED